MSMLTRKRILTLIPHEGVMCLLDTAEHWSATEIICQSARYASPDNPLRQADGTLAGACLIEIAAQAMALHGRLCGADDAPPPRPGLLVSLRDVTLHTGIVESTLGPLRIAANRLAEDQRGASYEFIVDALGRRLVEGRAMVLFAASA